MSREENKKYWLFVIFYIFYFILMQSRNPIILHHFLLPWALTNILNRKYTWFYAKWRRQNSSLFWFVKCLLYLTSNNRYIQTIGGKSFGEHGRCIFISLWVNERNMRIQHFITYINRFIAWSGNNCLCMFSITKSFH